MLDDGLVTLKVVVAKAARRLAGANVHPIVEEALRIYAISFGQPVQEKHLGVDDGLLLVVALDALVKIEIL